MSKRPKNKPNPTPYASDEELAKLEAEKLHSGPIAFKRYEETVKKVLSVPKEDFNKEWATEQEKRKQQNQ
ncbi:MAG: hypothetical protein JO316_03700 [Abitibacteriaceae bacterium]|nr:hypothetical protein [Abditibacteriaceae bacterium]